MSTMTWSVVRETVVACFSREDVLQFRDVRSGKFVSIPEVFHKLLIDNLILDQVEHDEEEDDMVQRVDSSEWQGYGYLNMEEDTDSDDTQYVIGAGQEEVREMGDDMQDQARVFEQSIMSKIQAFRSIGAQWADEKAEALEQWYEASSIHTQEGDEPTPMARWLKWSEEAGIWNTATGHEESEEFDYFGIHTLIEQEIVEEQEHNYNKMSKGLFRPDRYWQARTFKARYAVGKFMVEAKKIWANKKLERSQKEYRLGMLLHSSMKKGYDKRDPWGNGYMRGSGYNFLRWEGAGLRTDVLMRSVVMWMTKDENLAYCWMGTDGDLAFRNGKCVPNKYSEKIGQLYNLKDFKPLADFLRECMKLAE